MNERYITTWHKPWPNIFEWDYHVSEDLQEVARVVANLKEQGVHQYNTWKLGGEVVEHSTAY